MSHPDYRRFSGGTIQTLPDGRRLVGRFSQPVTLVDPEGFEVVPSPSELVALTALARMSFPRKNAEGKKLIRPYDGEDTCEPDS